MGVFIEDCVTPDHRSYHDLHNAYSGIVPNRTLLGHKKLAVGVLILVASKWHSWAGNYLDYGGIVNQGVS